MNWDRLLEQFPSVQVLPHFRGEQTLEVPRDDLIPVLKFLKEDPEYAFTMLVDLTAVDYLGYEGKETRFEVVYHLFSLKSRERVRIKVPVPEDEPEVDSVTSLWWGANWLEREVFDLFGIRFRGHPNLERLLLWEGFEGHPLRKDYPLREEPPLPEPK